MPLAALCAILLAAADAPAQRTLWLVQPLYPGQEALIARTEQAVAKLIPPEARANEVIGPKELVAALQGKPGDLSCLFGEKRCGDPIDAFVAALGFDRVVLVKGGQDESGFQYRVASYRPGSGEVSPAASSHAVLEKALLGALVKVVPLAATLEVKSTPPGATVLVDEVKVGQTPLSTQVLPGEQVVKIDLKGHQPIEETLVVPARGFAKLERVLEKIAARITVTASPPGTSIFIDGQLAGKDKIDRGIRPGAHTLRLSREGHRDFETAVEVRPDETYVLDKGLEAIPATAAPVEVAKPLEKPPPPPEPPSTTEQGYARRSYLRVDFESQTLSGGILGGRRYGDSKAETSQINSADRALAGASVEYGTYGRHFGLAVIGASYAQSARSWNFTVVNPEPDSSGTPQEAVDARVRLLTLRALQPQLRVVAWRLSAAVQAGLEVRTGQIIEPVDVPAYRDGFQPLDLLLSARGTARLFVFEGGFLEGAYAVGFNLLGKSAGYRAFNVGAGYAF
ncbi:MAG: PEGA domain-containing protein [Myxococcales bacterium]|nr:PEGA domain-containing protein [Myxococcales bacterium]